MLTASMLIHIIAVTPPPLHLLELRWGSILLQILLSVVLD